MKAKYLTLFLILVLIFSLGLSFIGFGLKREKIETLNDITFNQKTMLILNEDLSTIVGNQVINYKVILFFPEMRFCIFPYQILRVQE